MPTEEPPGRSASAPVHDASADDAIVAVDSCAGQQPASLALSEPSLPSHSRNVGPEPASLALSSFQSPPPHDSSFLRSPSFNSTSTTMQDAPPTLASFASFQHFAPHEDDATGPQFEQALVGRPLERVDLVAAMVLPPLMDRPQLGKHDDPRTDPAKFRAPPPSLQSVESFSSVSSSASDTYTFRSLPGRTITPAATPPLPSGPAIDPSDLVPSAAAFPLWIGSWNMGAKEMAPVPAGAPSPFHTWIPTGYKLYVIGLQEAVSEQTYRALDVFFAHKSFDCARVMIPEVGGYSGTIKVEGRGDGSFIYPKSTSLAAWIHRSARPHVSYLAHTGVSMGLTQGSKGGAALALKVVDTTLVFVACHLSSTTLAARRACYTTLIEAVGNALGERYFQLLEQFHHTFFLGDLNFRLVEGFGAAEAVSFMQRKDVPGLLAYDELTAEMASGVGAFGPFTEAPIDFFPTYKKHEGRNGSGDGSSGPPSRENIYWPHAVYKTIYKQPWYKTGNTAQRVPSWCDRVIFHSLRDQASRLTVLKYHPDEPRGDASSCSPAGRSLARVGGVGGICTYRALEDQLASSDHTAVSCGFQLALPKLIDWVASAASTLGTSGNQGMPMSAPALAHLSGSRNGTSSGPGSAEKKAVSQRDLLSGPFSGGNLALPPQRSVSSSVSSPNPRALQAPIPSVYIVRLISVRVMQAPPVSAGAVPAQVISPVIHTVSPSASFVGGLDSASSASFGSSDEITPTANLAPPTPGSIGTEPKYVRILFPAPFELSGSPPGISKQVAFPPGQPSPQLPIAQLQRAATGGDPNASATLDAIAQHPLAPTPTPWKAEFRCLSFDDGVSFFPSSAPPSSPSDPLPLWTPYHLLLKIHSFESVSGQCCVPLPKASFERGHVLEFRERMTRDGLPLTHPYTKQHMQVHFVLQLECTKGSSAVQSAAPSRTGSPALLANNSASSYATAAGAPANPPAFVKANSDSK